MGNSLLNKVFARGHLPPPGPTNDAFLINIGRFTDGSKAGGGVGEERDRIEFTYMPHEIEERKSAKYANTYILGRSEPIVGYWASEARMFGLKLHFAAHGEYIDLGGAMGEVLDNVRTLRSWVYPDYEGSSGSPGTGRPPELLLVVGQWLDQRVILRDIQIKYMAPWGYGDAELGVPLGGLLDLGLGHIIEDRNLLSESSRGLKNVGDFFGDDAFRGPDILNDSLRPYLAVVNLSLQEVNEKVFSYNEIRNGDDVGYNNRLGENRSIFPDIPGKITGLFK